MEAKNIILYILFATAVYIIITGIVNIHQVSDDIKASRRTIDSVMTVVKDSRKIIEHQTNTIDQLQKLNTDLYQKVQKTDSLNKIIKSTIDAKFSTTNKSLKDLKKELEKIQIPVIH